ncbi:hypothetical protein GYMLUDRAFT_56720 [Collybiopsis luxurians FD-317 M1]|nr:hypothetical protein GYMLUDRAFT_56720 [Collybiopsis luxurians FD-317 M1]
MSTMETPRTQPPRQETLSSRLLIHMGPPSTVSNLQSPVHKLSQIPRPTQSVSGHSQGKNSLFSLAPSAPHNPCNVSASVSLPPPPPSPEPHQINASSERGSNKSMSTRHPHGSQPANLSAAETIEQMRCYESRQGPDHMATQEEVAPKFPRPFQGQGKPSLYVQNSASVVNTMNTVDKLPNTAVNSATNAKGKNLERYPNQASTGVSKTQGTQHTRAPSHISNAMATTAQYLEYERQLRRHIILQYLCELDLDKYSFTYINDQDVRLDINENVVISRENSNTKLHYQPITEAEIVPYRRQFPVPFSAEDTHRQHSDQCGQRVGIVASNLEDPNGDPDGDDNNDPPPRRGNNPNGLPRNPPPH